MKRAKRLVAMLLVVALLAVTPAAAMAAEYVPTKGTSYWKNGTKWEKGTEYTWSYKGDGKITKRTWKDPDGTSSTSSYKWKGNFLSKITWSSGQYSTYKYKNSRLQSFTSVYGGGKRTTKLKWDKKKKKATYKSGDFTITLTFNSKGQLVKETDKSAAETYTYKYKYYSNGNVKKISGGSNKGYQFTTNYNKKGYLSSETGKDGIYSWSYKYSYKTKNGKITERISKSNGVESSKTVYTKWKKVSRVRNCDGMGRTTPLG